MTDLEDWNLLSRRVGQIVIQAEKDHVGEEKTEGGQEVPDVVVVVEVEHDALLVEVAGLCWRQHPAGGRGEEEVERPGPGQERHDDVEQGLDQDALPVPQLHHEIKLCVQQKVVTTRLKNGASKFSTSSYELKPISTNTRST